MPNNYHSFAVSSPMAFGFFARIRSVGWAALLALAACTASGEHALRRDLRAAGAGLRGPASQDIEPESNGGSWAPSEARRAGQMGQTRTSFEEYLATALSRHPTVRAAFSRWKASVSRISAARRLPEPTVSFGLFLRSVETRVGPQRARVSLQQAFPWPTKLSAGANSAAAEAQAAQQRFEANALRVAEGVAVAYWTLWQVRETHKVHLSHLKVMKALSDTVRARMITGGASLADLQQIELTAARLQDGIYGMQEAERRAAADLRYAVGGARLPTVLSTHGAGVHKEVQVPSESLEQLRAYTREHPVIRELDFRANAKNYMARAKDAERFPSFTVGADWIVTSAATASEVPQSGKDAVMVGTGIRIPLFVGTYDDAVQTARAEAGAFRLDQRGEELRFSSKLESALSFVRDAARRVQLHSRTLLPLADAAYASVLGAYTAGRGTAAQLLLAQRDLLELSIVQLQARADYARSWAKLEYVVGRTLPRRRFDEAMDAHLHGVQALAPAVEVTQADERGASHE